MAKKYVVIAQYFNGGGYEVLLETPSKEEALTFFHENKLKQVEDLERFKGNKPEQLEELYFYASSPRNAYDFDLYVEELEVENPSVPYEELFYESELEAETLESFNIESYIAACTFHVYYDGKDGYYCVASYPRKDQAEMEAFWYARDIDDPECVYVSEHPNAWR